MNVTPASTPCTELLDTAITTGQLGRDPYPIFATLRECDPVCRSHRWGCWVVSRSADVATLLRDTRRLSSAGRVVNAMRQSYNAEDQRAANRDPEAFDDPDTFNLHRPSNRHVSFGYGVHFCLGAALVRLEAPIALRDLLQCFPDVQLDGEAIWHDGMVRCLRSLHLSLAGLRASTPARKPASTPASASTKASAP